MAKIAHVMYGRVRAVYDTDMTFEEWRLAHCRICSYDNDQLRHN